MDPSTLTWGALDPGNDFAAEAIRSIFANGAGGGPGGGIGPAGTVTGNLLGYIAGGVGLIMIMFVVYNAVVQATAAAESGRVRDERRSSWSVLRVALAALLLFPLANGFGAGQALLSQIALAGLGLGVAGASTAVQQIGPQAQLINQPMIPGVKRVVSGLIVDELCAALVNEAANNPRLIPSPSPVQGTSLPGGGGSFVTVSYDMGSGNTTTGAVCGSVTVRTYSGTAAGGTIDMSGQQQAILDDVLTGTIRPAVRVVAQDLWQHRGAGSLTPLMSTLQSATASYIAQLTAAATTATQSLRSLYTLQTMRNGAADDGGVTQLGAMGWSGLGAYYFELARLQGQESALMSAVPVVNPPSWDGLGTYFSGDLAPLVRAALEFQDRLDTYVATSDPLDVAPGGADLFAGATPSRDGAGVLEGVLRRMNFSEAVLGTFMRHLAPSQTDWADPFSATMNLGNDMVMIALAAIGAAAVLASGVTSTALTAWNLMTFNFAGAAATVTGHAVMQFLATPIYYALLAILIPGAFMAFVVPMVPAVLWTMGVLGWLVRFVEAQIAAPLWLFAHVSFAGDGIHGRGVRGWGNVFVLLTQPILMVAAMFVSYWAFATYFHLLNIGFYTAASFTLQQGWLVANLFGVIVLLCMYVLTLTVGEIQCFRLLSALPTRAAEWIGIDATERVDSHALTQAATMVGMASVIDELNKGTASVVAAKEAPVLAEDSNRMLGMDRTVAASTEASAPLDAE